MSILTMDHAPQEALIEPSPRSEASIPIAQNEIAQVRQTIQDAQYFDPTSMAALTPASLVSISMCAR